MCASGHWGDMNTESVHPLPSPAEAVQCGRGKTSDAVRPLGRKERPSGRANVADKKTYGMRDTTRPRQGGGPQPPPPKEPPPEPRSPLSAFYPTGELATPYGPEEKKRYSPARPFRGVISLNMDSIRDQKDILFADPHGLKASVILFQDHRLSEKEAEGFIKNTS